MNINDMMVKVHANSRAKGWWDEQTRPDGTLDPMKVEEAIPLKLALVHSEVSEALEEYRKDDGLLCSGFYTREGKPEGFGVELADAAIRIFDLCEALGINLADCIQRKHAYNLTRPHRHGGKRA